MPVIPKIDGKGYPGFVYLAWHSKLAGNRATRTVGQARRDTDLSQIGSSLAYLCQCKGAEQLGPKRTADSAYRLTAITGLEPFLARLTAAHVAETLSLPEKRVLAWPGDQKSVPLPSGPDTLPAPATPKAASIPSGAENPETSGLRLGHLEAALSGALRPLLQRLSALEESQAAIRRQLENIQRSSSSGVSNQLETALVQMIGLLRDLPQNLVHEQTQQITATLQDEGKHTGRAIRALREGLDFQNREIVAVLSKVSDSLTRLLASRDSVLMSLASSLHNALSLVPEEDLPAAEATASPSRVAASLPLAQPEPALSAGGNGSDI